MGTIVVCEICQTGPLILLNDLDDVKKHLVRSFTIERQNAFLTEEKTNITLELLDKIALLQRENVRYQQQNAELRAAIGEHNNVHEPYVRPMRSVT